MATKYSIHDISILQNRKVFFDANVLIYLFWPSGSYNWEKDYSSVYAKLLRQKNELFVDFIVISEIINRAIRLEYDKYLATNNISKFNHSFKKYRNSADGQTALSDIYLIVETNILNSFTIIGKTFTKNEIRSFLITDNLDIADKGIVKICKENTCILLTNDVDFKTSDIEILTSNPTLLRN